MEKIVRLATIEDFEFIYDAICEDLKEQNVFHRFKYSKSEFQKAIFGRKSIATFLILLINGDPAGFANYSIDYRNFTVNSLSNLYLNDLFVKNKYRRNGGATFLVEELKKIAEKNNCGRIEWIVLIDNIVAINFYKKVLKANIISDKLHYMRLDLKS